MEWRSLEEFPDYQFSDTGLVKKNGKYRSPYLGHSYPTVYLSNKFVRKQVRLHTIIAELFIGPCPEGFIIRHLDDDKENNQVSNLAYGTDYDNKQDAIRNDKIPKGEKHGCAKLTQVEVNEIRNTEYYYGCIETLAKEYDVSRSTISSIRTGRTWK
jgi:hypothetical protein